MTRARAVCVLGLLLATSMLIAPAARAESLYRYWSYWSIADGTWHFATVGPGSSVPADGAVEGWHFVITSQQGGAADAPKVPAASAFDDICGTTAPAAGRKRVAMVVDFGMPKDAPAGEHQPVGITECLTADIDASGYELLSTVADVRAENGLVCGIDSYPLAECAEVVDPASLAAPTSVTEQLMPTSSSGSTGPLVSGLTLLVLGGLGYAVWKRRRT